MHQLKTYVNSWSVYHIADDEINVCECVSAGRDSHLVAHPVHLLYVREDHLGVDTVVSHHGLHVVSGQEVGDTSISPEQRK